MTSPSTTETPPGARPDWLGFLLYAGRRFREDRCFQAAGTLTYASLLALVPLTTILVGVFSAFPTFSTLAARARDTILDALVPEVGMAIAEALNTFVGNTGRLTAIGFIGLVVTAILLLSSIESAFNNIWRVRESRPFVVRLLGFWAVLTLTPVLFGATLSLTSALGDPSTIAPAAWREAVASVLPFLFEAIGVSLLYKVIPNRPVRWLDCLIAGAVAALALELAKAGFALYLTNFPVYETIYGAIATIPIFLVWLYLLWSILLVGAIIAAALPEWRSGRILGARAEELLSARRVMVAAAILAELVKGSRVGKSLRRRALLTTVPVGSATLDSMLDELRQARFVERVGTDHWILARNLELATLGDLMRALGIGLRGQPSLFPDTRELWRDRLVRLLERAAETERSLLGMPLARLFAEDGEQKALPSPEVAVAAAAPVPAVEPPSGRPPTDRPAATGPAMTIGPSTHGTTRAAPPAPPDRASAAE